jgi:RNA polymerase sigma-70 factor (ECF subfamily)
MAEQNPNLIPSPDGRATTRCLRVGPYLRHDDKKLVEMVLAGDRKAYDELVERHQAAAIAAAKNVVKDYQRAEDLAQEAFIKAYLELGRLQELNKFGQWLMTIVRHTAVDFLRAKKDGLSLDALRDQGWEAERFVADETAHVVEVREENLHILEVLGELREDYRRIVIMKHLEHRSYKEIARALGMSVSAVGEKLSRVRGILKERLEKQKIVAPDADAEAEVRPTDDGERKAPKSNRGNSSARKRKDRDQ